MTSPDAALAWMRKLCSSFPSTTESVHFGEAVFKVRGKIFASCGVKDGAGRIVAQLESDHARLLIANDPRFTAYPGQRDCVVLEVANLKGWPEVRALVEESYHLNAAPKRPAVKKSVVKKEPAAKTKPAAKAKRAAKKK